MEPKTACILIVVGIVLVISIILFALSWDTLEPYEWGLLCNSISKNCDGSEIYDGGRYFVWLAHYFISFPGTYQTIEFSTYTGANSPPLRTRTAEGLALGLHLSFQYQLVKEQLPSLYAMNNLDYETTFIRIARDVILQAAGKYEAPYYWEKRGKIGDDMRAQLDTELRKAHAKCIQLQLLNIELPDQYEDSIVDTQVEVQKKKMKTFEQQAELIRQEIDILRSEAFQTIKTINATAAADAYQIRQEAVANATNITIKAEQEAFLEAKDSLELSATELNKYFYYLSLNQQKNSKFLVGLNNGIINLGGNSNNDSV